MELIYNINFQKITFLISTENAYKTIYNNLAGGKTMEILRKKEFEEDRLFQNFHEMILYHMRQMQECLTTAGKMFCEQNNEEQLCEKRGRDVVESVILKECVGCRENKTCQFTLADKDKLGQIIEKQGGLSCADLKRCHPCKNGQDFIEEANQIYERELFLRAMKNQMKQLRTIVGEQYIRAGNTLGDFFQGKVVLTEDNKKLYQKITKGFAKSPLKLKEIYFYENPEKGKQIYLYLKKKKGREISTRQAAVLLSSMTMEKMKPLLDQKKMIGNSYEIYGFTAEEKFHVIAGIRTSSMLTGDQNGDSFSMGKVREGRFAAMISDGMGTGKDAHQVSKKMVEVMEELLGAGISEEQSIQLLRSMMVLTPEKERYATLDFFQLDLFAGIGTFFKMGACPCLLKRKNNVEIIQMETAPINLLLHTDKIPICRKKMESDDILVMLSDGVFDGFSQNGMEMAAQYLKEMDVVRPQAIADGLYEQITANQEFEKRDDITIMALGIWDRY